VTHPPIIDFDDVAEIAVHYCLFAYGERSFEVHVALRAHKLIIILKSRKNKQRVINDSVSCEVSLN
jgi:hypothetical protein